MRFLKQNTEITIIAGPFLAISNGITPVTTAATDIGTNGNYYVTSTLALSVSAGHELQGYYTIVLTATHTATLGSLRLWWNNPTTYLPVYEDFTVVRADVYDTLFGSVGINNIADAVLNRDLTTAAASSTFTLASRSLLNAVRFLRNKWSISGGTLTVTAENDTTTAWTSAITTTSGANPVTATDPA